MRHHPSIPLIGFVVATLAGCTAPPPMDSHTCDTISESIADPNAMPDDVVTYLADHHWSHMHLDFHVARMWDVLDMDTQTWAAGMGIARAPKQEGEPTTGLEFLAMHRLMLTELRGQFPDHAALFVGWETPPTDPSSPDGMLPAGTPAFDPDMVKGIARIETQPDSFTSDDDFALFLQTKRRPTAADKYARSKDPSAGIHNYVHNRWQSDSPINVGDPAVNLQNQVFWRVHGWVDTQWTAYRKAKGLDDATDPVYLAALADAQTWMDAAMMRGEMAAGSKADDACETEPDQVKTIFSE